MSSPPSRIRLLPDHLVSQIAAGEVVERPASVVKELLENALDAGSLRVAVDLEAGGKRRVAVSDDGHGMGPEDVLLAFDRHATSKIASFEDLERVASLGFRGEALASIASVARVELSSATEDGEGRRVRIEGGRVRAVEPMARPRGTSVEVEALFWNVPARRKFLKSPETELRRVVETVQGLAMARPEVAFRLRHEGRVVLDLEARAALRERLADLFGSHLADGLVAIAAASADAAGPVIGGFVGGPDTARGRRTFVWVNRRLVRDRAILATFYRAVREVWRSEDFPALFLDLRVPPEDVDVNVHPQKAEVRFRDPRLLDRVEAALREALERARGTREVEGALRAGGWVAGTPLAGAGLGGVSTGWWGPHGRRPDEGPAGAGEAREAASAEAGDYGALTARIAQASIRPWERAIVPLSGRGEPVVRSLRLLGQYKGTILLFEGPEGLVLVDQHVAHERILYERFRRAMAGSEVAVQRLVHPAVFAVSPAEGRALAALAPAFELLGFEFSPLSGNTLGLTALPAGLAVQEAERLLLGVAASNAESERDASAEAERLRRQLLDEWAAQHACRAAVKMHQTLSPDAIEGLMAELFRCESPFACPHGRPTVLSLSDAEIERRFERR